MANVPEVPVGDEDLKKDVPVQMPKDPTCIGGVKHAALLKIGLSTPMRNIIITLICILILGTIAALAGGINYRSEQRNARAPHPTDPPAQKTQTAYPSSPKQAKEPRARSPLSTSTGVDEGSPPSSPMVSDVLKKFLIELIEIQHSILDRLSELTDQAYPKGIPALPEQTEERSYRLRGINKRVWYTTENDRRRPVMPIPTLEESSWKLFSFPYDLFYEIAVTMFSK